ncbi:MAG: prepilin-type N-terminal cleavage/methylation domain-containing protein [Terriglobia bacterium]|jgi:prepilin-type N-terminal cleavage/methylation domain-containing protein
MRKESSGFSLIELLIVVAIILIIAAIAIPDLLKSRQAANQASAVGSLRTMNTSEVTYSSTYTLGFSYSLAALDGPSGGVSSAANAGLIDSILGGGIKSTYGFSYSANPASPSTAVACANPPTQNSVAASVNVTSYTITASPILCVAGNGNYYFTDQSGVIRMNNGQVATSTDNPLAG